MYNVRPSRPRPRFHDDLTGEHPGRGQQRSRPEPESPGLDNSAAFADYRKARYSFKEKDVGVLRGAESTRIFCLNKTTKQLRQGFEFFRKNKKVQNV